MSIDFCVEPLQEEHIAELDQAIRKDIVYAYIGGAAPPSNEFALGLKRALRGPPISSSSELWLNYLVRDSQTQDVIGRLEATVVGDVAEVAFLYAPEVWGRGYASKGILWLHDEVMRQVGGVQFWATTVPANLRCQALLRRSGYIETSAQDAPLLRSYDEGDLIFSFKNLSEF